MLRRNGIRSRGLCANCYEWIRTRGRLEDYPRVRGIAADRVEDWEFLKRYEGLTVKQAAERMGIHENTLRRSIKAMEASQ